MIAGARAVGVSPSIIGSLPRKEAALVEVNFSSFGGFVSLTFFQCWRLLSRWVMLQYYVI